MVKNKRKKAYAASEIRFPHSDVLLFIDKHHEFLNPEQIIKVMILIPRFRLPLHILITNHVKFDMDFLTMSIEANNWECAFFILNRYENLINREA